MIEGLQGIVACLGLPEGVQPLLPQCLLHPADKAEVGPAPLEVGGGDHGVQADAAVGPLFIGQGGRGGQEGQRQGGNEQMLHPVGPHGRGTDDYILPRSHGPGGQPGEQVMGQPVGVAELIDPLAQGVRRIKLAQNPLPGDAAQEALYRLARLSPGLFQLPAEDAPGPLGQLGL